MAGTSSIVGLQSGLDTTSIVDSLMKLEQKPVDRLTQEQTNKTNIISAFQALQAKMLALASQARNLSQPANWSKYGVTVSDDKVLTATAGSSAAAGSYDLQVLSVARSNTIASQGFADQSTAILGVGTITLALGTGSAQTITVDASNNSLVGIAKAINDAKAGVTASIVNDGSKSNPYRLVLTGTKTGQANKISITTQLSGGQSLNYSTPTFDTPEKLNVNTASTAAITLGGTAAYTGTQNKTYTFTVAGTGTKTVGTDNITLNWSDGTNNGSIVVTQADMEVALVGAGADGLKLNSSSGKMTGGDTFQIQSFSPVLQQAADAKISIGSGDGTGSPISISSATNSFQNVIGGLSFNVLKTTDAGTSVTVQSAIDTSALKSKINDFISAYNDVNKFINDQNKYDSDTKSSGVLFGDLSLDSMQSSLRNAFSSLVPGLSSQYNQLYAIGIRSDANGNLSVKDASKLDDALQNHQQDVIKLFTASASASNNNIQFISAGSKAKVGQALSVDITHAATQGKFIGGTITDPASNPVVLTTQNGHLQISVDGINSAEIVLTSGTYTTADDLVNEIQSKIDSDPNIGSRGVMVSWESFTSGTGRLVLKSSSYGSQSKVTMVSSITNSAFSVLGLATGSLQNGTDVAGTINGEPADGAGQILTARDANKTTSGIKIKVTLDSAQVGLSNKSTITLAKGVSAMMADLLDSFTASGEGMIDRRVKAYQDQVDDLKQRITDYNARLATKREDIMNKFNAMESVLAQLNSQSSYLSGQLASMNSNWSWNSSSNNG